MEFPESGWIALVGYLPEPQNSFIEALRLSAPAKTPAPVHITVLPPRPLKAPLEEACRLIDDLMSDVCAFEAELCEVRHFKESDFLYIDIGAGSAELCDIHHQLNTGVLQHPEAYEFIPHLTLCGPLTPNEVEKAQRQTESEWKASACPRKIKIKELVCLWLKAGEIKEWKRHHLIRLLENDTCLPVSA